MLVRQALHLDPANTSPYLTITKTAALPSTVTGWMPRSGEIYVTPNLYDQAHVERYHNWRVVDSPADRPVTLQAALVAHELGHVFIDGIRITQAAMEVQVASPEDAYTPARHHLLAPPRSPRQ